MRKQILTITLTLLLATTLASKLSAQPEQQPRPTSTPYAGDLSIFEYPDRDQKLHIGPRPGPALDHLGQVRSRHRRGLRLVHRPRRRQGRPQRNRLRRRHQSPRPSTTSPSAPPGRNSPTSTPSSAPSTTPKIPVASVDAVLLLKAYHEFAQPLPLMEKLRLSLKPGAKVGIIDRNGDGTDHGIMPNVVESEMAKAGFKRIGKYDFTKSDGQDYFLIFTAK